MAPEQTSEAGAREERLGDLKGGLAVAPSLVRIYFLVETFCSDKLTSLSSLSYKTCST